MLMVISHFDLELLMVMQNPKKLIVNIETISRCYLPGYLCCLSDYGALESEVWAVPLVAIQEICKFYV